MIKRLLQLFRRPAPWYEQYFGWIVLAGVLLVMGISLGVGLMQSVWFDEAYSILLAKKSAGEIMALTGVDTHPPFYYLLLHAWGNIFGWSELALRLPSVLAMGGAAAVGTLLVKRMFGVRAALVALAFVVLAPFLMRYGFEIRMYALASLIVVSATYVLVVAVNAKDKTKQLWLYAAYAALVALGVYTLYYTAVLWIVHVVWLVYLARQRKESVLKQRWWLAYLGSLVLFLPWLPAFIRQLGNGALAPISQPLNVENLVGVASFWALYQPSWQLSGLMTLVLLAAIVFATLILSRAFKNAGSKERPYLVLLALYAGLPVLIVALISLIKPMYVERYLAHVTIGISLLMGSAAWLAGWQKSQTIRLYSLGIIAVLLLGVMNLANTGNFNFQRLQLPEIKQLASTIPCGDNSTIVAADPYVAIELSYYLEGCRVQFYSESADLHGGYAPLAFSPLRITDPAGELRDTKELTYVYYDEPKLTLPDNLKETKKLSFGPLHSATFMTE